MKWPWVSRMLFDHVLHDLNQWTAQHAQAEDFLHRRIDALEQALASERARYTALTAQVVEMRKDGFGPGVLTEPETPQEPPLPNVVADAIALRGVTPALEADLRRFASTVLGQGTAPEKVAAAILAGTDDEEVW